MCGELATLKDLFLILPKVDIIQYAIFCVVWLINLLKLIFLANMSFQHT